MTNTGGDTAGTIVVGSAAPSLAVFSSPPPLTVPALTTVAGALGATLTVSVIVGYVAPAPSASARVHVSVASVHVHPAPAIAVALSPAGNASETTTTSDVGPAPAFATDTVYVAPVCPRVNVPVCAIASVRSAGATTVAVSTAVSFAPFASPPPATVTLFTSVPAALTATLTDSVSVG